MKQRLRRSQRRLIGSSFRQGNEIDIMTIRYRWVQEDNVAHQMNQKEGEEYHKEDASLA